MHFCLLPLCCWQRRPVSRNVLLVCRSLFRMICLPLRKHTFSKHASPACLPSSDPNATYPLSFHCSVCFAEGIQADKSEWKQMRFVLSSHREILQFCRSVSHTHTHSRFSEHDVYSHQHLLSMFFGYAFELRVWLKLAWLKLRACSRFVRGD